MKIRKSILIKLGIFIVSGILIFVAAVYYLGRQQNIFRSGITVYSEFPNVKGLQTGNNVRYLGTNAGYVSSIRILSDTIVQVRMIIDNKMSDFIRQNSEVEIQNDGVMGSKIIVIHPGTMDYNTITTNTVLPSLSSMSIEEIFGALEGTVDYTTRAAQNLYLVSQTVLDGEGLLGKLIHDREMERMIDDLAVNLVEVTNGTGEILNKMNTPDNDIGNLLNEQNVTLRITEVFDGLDTVMHNLARSSDEIKKASQALNREDGIINKFLYDSTFATEVDTTVVKLNSAIENLMQTSDKIRTSWIFNLFPGGRR